MRFVFDSKPTVIVELWVYESSVGVYNDFIQQTLSFSLEICQKKQADHWKKSLNGLWDLELLAQLELTFP